MPDYPAERAAVATCVAAARGLVRPEAWRDVGFRRAEVAADRRGAPSELVRWWLRWRSELRSRGIPVYPAAWDGNGVTLGLYGAADVADPELKVLRTMGQEAARRCGVRIDGDGLDWWLCAPP